jgi:hypothetical protein
VCRLVYSPPVGGDVIIGAAEAKLAVSLQHIRQLLVCLKHKPFESICKELSLCHGKMDRSCQPGIVLT